MSPCASISLRRVGGISVGFHRVETGMEVSAKRVGGCVVSADKVSGMDATFDRVGGHLLCRIKIVCKTNITVPYLEIEPEIIWVLNGWASNDVYSNVVWNVN